MIYSNDPLHDFHGCNFESFFDTEGEIPLLQRRTFSFLPLRTFFS